MHSVWLVCSCQKGKYGAAAMDSMGAMVCFLTLKPVNVFEYKPKIKKSKL